jgi:hypothetical protein
VIPFSGDPPRATARIASLTLADHDERPAPRPKARGI